MTPYLALGKRYSTFPVRERLRIAWLALSGQAIPEYAEAVDSFSKLANQISEYQKLIIRYQQLLLDKQ